MDGRRDYVPEVNYHHRTNHSLESGTMAKIQWRHLDRLQSKLNLSQLARVNLYPPSYVTSGSESCTGSQVSLLSSITGTPLAPSQGSTMVNAEQSRGEQRCICRGRPPMNAYTSLMKRTRNTALQASLREQTNTCRQIRPQSPRLTAQSRYTRRERMTHGSCQPRKSTVSGNVDSSGLCMCRPGIQEGGKLDCQLTDSYYCWQADDTPFKITGSQLSSKHAACTGAMSSVRPSTEHTCSTNLLPPPVPPGSAISHLAHRINRNQDKRFIRDGNPSGPPHQERRWFRDEARPVCRSQDGNPFPTRVPTLRRGSQAAEQSQRCHALNAVNGQALDTLSCRQYAASLHLTMNTAGRQPALHPQNMAKRCLAKTPAKGNDVRHAETSLQTTNARQLQLKKNLPEINLTGVNVIRHQKPD